MTVPYSDRVPALRRFLPLLLVLFVGSGCSALIYEIVWYQLLELVIGSSAVSLGVLLGTFMGGLCLGSLLLARVISPRRHPLRVYAFLELGIAACGLLVLFGMPYVGRLYAASVGLGLPGFLLRGAVCAVCLLVPTMLMGATLPAIARWVETTPRGVSWLGFFYGGNTAGAVFGCLLAGFYLLRVHDMATATYFAALVNGSVAFFSLALSILAPPYGEQAGDPQPGGSARAVGAWAIYVTIALSGLTALGAEVIWTRLLSLMLGATVYTFSIILSVFLLGLGIGSSAGSVAARGTPRPRFWLGCSQLCLAAAIAWTAAMIARSLPYWPINPTLSSSPWFTFQLDLVRCLWAVLPAACLWGASFPLALAAVASRGQDPGRLVGGVYAANTVGAILGALTFSMLLIPRIGTQQSQRLLIGLAAVSALIALVPVARWSWAGAAALLAGLALAGLLARSVIEIPWGVVAYGRQLLTQTGNAGVLYMGEGMNASIAISQWSDGRRLFHVSGKVEASSEPHDMRLQRMLGHIPALLHPKPRSVLVVGFGAGVTAGSFALYPGIERIVICEIEPLIPPVTTRYFGQENYHVLNNPRVTMVYDDARHYILTTKEKFDIITSDPIHPWVKGSATLYSKEYFEMCKRRLNPGGLITQWVPLYESNVATVKSELATFFDVFPNGTLWGNDIDGSGYDSVLLGQVGPLKIDMNQLVERLNRPEYAPVATSLNDVLFHTVPELFGTYAGQASDMRAWLKGAEINRDRSLHLQYLAGMGLNLQQGSAIYNEILRHRHYPEQIFSGSEKLVNALRQRFY